MNAHNGNLYKIEVKDRLAGNVTAFTYKTKREAEEVEAATGLKKRPQWVM